MANTVVTLTNTNIAIATADIGNTDVLVALAPANATNNVTLLSISSDYTELITQIAASLSTTANTTPADYSNTFSQFTTSFTGIESELDRIADNTAVMATNSARIATALEGIQAAVEAIKERASTRTQGIYTRDINEGLTGVQKRALTVSSLTEQDINDISREINNPTSLPGDE